MPHLILEYSGNIEPSDTTDKILADLNRALANTAGIDIGSCKSRIYKAENFSIGHGCDGGAFVHLEVKVLAGKSANLIKNAGGVLCKILKNSFTGEGMTIQFTVEFSEMKREFYFKEL